MLKACLKPLIYRIWKPKIESKTESEARASGQEPWAVRTGQVFLVQKVIMEFYAGLSGRANVSIRTDAFRRLVITFRMFNLYKFFLAFQRR
jgi:hypothetical protein